MAGDDNGVIPRSRPPATVFPSRVPPVSRVLSASCDTGRSFLSVDGRPPTLAANPRRPDRRGLLLAAYLALLPLGFAVPPVLPRTRWALTPPFHPYLGFRKGGLFSVALSVTRRTACPGVTWQRVQGARTFLGAYQHATRSSGGTSSDNLTVSGDDAYRATLAA